MDDIILETIGKFNRYQFIWYCGDMVIERSYIGILGSLFIIW